MLLPRIFKLDTFVTADEKRWQANVNGFTRHLALLEWNNLLQQPHPGITTQWLGALTIHSDSWAVKKLPLVIGQSILVLVIGYIFSRLWGKRAAMALALLLALNPLLIAHTRVYAMDSLLALFTLLSLGLLLLWQKTNATRYLAAAGMSAALAVLSKLSGVTLVPFSIGFIVWQQRRYSLKPLALWLVAFFITAILVLPSLVTNTIPIVQEIQGFFSSNSYETEHQGAVTYYLGTLFFFSTPLQLLAIIALPFIWWQSRRVKTPLKPQLIWLTLFATLFTLQMAIGSKKGDRYVLPTFLIADALVVGLWLLQPRRLVNAVFVLGIVWQGLIVWQLHPYTLAYVNPLTIRYFSSRHLGWGEGLDLAARYLDAKPNASNLKVAAYYPNEFGYHFTGEVIPLSHYENSNADYAILYRAMFDRGPDAWETDVLNHFKTLQPEKTIAIGGLPYVWIYRLK